MEWATTTRERRRRTINREGERGQGGRDFISPTFKYQRFDLIRCKEMDGVRSGAEERARVLDAEAAEREARTNGVERELRLEREWRTSLQETSISNTEKISQLYQEIDQLKRVSEVRRAPLRSYR